MIANSSVREFLARPLRNSDKAKRFSSRALDVKLARLGVETQTPLRHAQKVCFLLGLLRKSYLFLLGMGSGKTLLALTLIDHLRETNQTDRALILVPNVVNIGAWIEQVAEHLPYLTIDGLTVNGPDARWAVTEGDATLVVMTYSGLNHLVCKREKKGRKRKPGLSIVDSQIARIKKQFNVLIMDESTALKNSGSLTFKVLKKLAKSIEYRYALTGTPFGTDPSDLWSQFYIIDSGKSLGETIGLYHQTFFSRKYNHWSGGDDWEFKKSLSKKLHRRLRHCSIRFTEEECQDLPMTIGGISADKPLLWPVTLPKKTWPYYKALHEQFVAAGKKLQAIEAAYTRMRMCASGWIGARTEEGERVEIVFDENPKIDALIELLNELPQEEQVIVVHIFHKTGDLISEALKKAKVKHVHVYGGVSAKKKLENVDKFKAGKVRVLLGSTAIAYGLNLQNARYMVFVESPDSQIDRKQIEARIRRGGGDHSRVYFYDIVAKNTVDEGILESVIAGKRLVDRVVDGEVKI